MKVFLLAVISAFFLFSSCGKEPAQETFLYQNFTSRNSLLVKRIWTVSDLNFGQFYYPRFSPDGAKIFFTTSDYEGIWYYDIEKKITEKLTSQKGAGYNFKFSLDGDKIYYIVKTQGGSRSDFEYSFVEQNLVTKEIRLILNSSKRINNPVILEQDNIGVYKNDSLIIINTETLKQVDSPNSKNLLFRISENILNINLFGKIEDITPFPNNRILWAEKCPADNRLLFYSIGKGTFLLDPETKIHKYLGDFRNAKWSPTTNLITFMIDKDDGLKITDSDIYVTPVDTIKIFNITNTADEIELNPGWSPGGDKIVFNTVNGLIKIAEIEID